MKKEQERVTEENIKMIEKLLTVYFFNNSIIFS